MAAKLASAFTAAEIKTLLRERKLKVSGRKEECVDRLIAADAAGAEAALAGVTSYICTSEGRALAAGFVAGEEEKRRLTEEQTLRQLQTGDLRGAVATVARFESEQVFQRGIGVDWANPDLAGGARLLDAILTARPKILKGIPVDQWQPAQIAAAMMHLWGTSSARAWRPASFTGSTNLDPDTTVRMIFFEGKSRSDIAGYWSAGITRVEVSGSGDSCPECMKIAGKKFRIADAPGLPYEHCTCEMGCRCMLLPVVD